ncbi:MAG: helix-turn-helix transcriptional regulator [Ruminococcus sp.]|nr:MAG: helix-turn-helix transcriptional regulator [Ruminococcus sp.]
MDRTYYASVEAGKRNISIKNIKKIADGFQISLEELFLKTCKGDIIWQERIYKVEIIGKPNLVPAEKAGEAEHNLIKVFFRKHLKAQTM